MKQTWAKKLKKSGKAPLRREGGNALVSVMFAMAMLSFVLAGSAQFASQLTRNLMRSRIIANRDHIEEKLQKALVAKSLLSDSTRVVGNEAFKRCFLGRVTNGCTTTAKPEGLFVLHPGKTLSLISGTEDRPARYDMEGQRCKDSSLNCPIEKYPIEVVSSFIAYCPGEAPSCTRPNQIEIFYSIRNGKKGSAPVLIRQLGQVLHTKEGSVVLGIDPPLPKRIALRVRQEPSESFNNNCLTVSANDLAPTILGCSRDFVPNKVVYLMAYEGLCNTIRLSYTINGRPAIITTNPIPGQEFWLARKTGENAVRVEFEDGGFETGGRKFIDTKMDHNDFVLSVEAPPDFNYQLEGSGALACR